MKILGGARDWVHRFLRQESTQEMRDAVHVSRLQKAAGSYMTLYMDLATICLGPPWT